MHPRRVLPSFCCFPADNHPCSVPEKAWFRCAHILFVDQNSQTYMKIRTTAAKKPSQTLQPTPVFSAMTSILFMVPRSRSRVLSNVSFILSIMAEESRISSPMATVSVLRTLTLLRMPETSESFWLSSSSSVAVSYWPLREEKTGSVGMEPGRRAPSLLFVPSKLGSPALERLTSSLASPAGTLCSRARLAARRCRCCPGIRRRCLRHSHSRRRPRPGLRCTAGACCRRRPCSLRRARCESRAGGDSSRRTCFWGGRELAYRASFFGIRRPFSVAIRCASLLPRFSVRGLVLSKTPYIGGRGRLTVVRGGCVVGQDLPSKGERKQQQQHQSWANVPPFLPNESADEEINNTYLEAMVMCNSARKNWTRALSVPVQGLRWAL